MDCIGLRLAAVAFMMISGCISDSPVLPAAPVLPTPCTFVMVPSSYGDQYEYAAEGKLILAFTVGGILVDWSIVDPSVPSKAQALELPPTSKIIIAVAHETKTRLSLPGSMRPGVQVSYWAIHPDHSRPLPFYDEWFDSESGALLQVVARAPGSTDGEPYHHEFMTRSDRPGLFLSALFWETTIHPGVRGQLSFARWSDKPEGDSTLDYGVDATYIQEERCHAKVHADFRNEAQATNYRLSFELEENLPVPRSYEEHYQRDGQEARLAGALHLLSISGRGAQHLAAFHPAQSDSQTSLSLAPLEDGFLAGGQGVFPTSFAVAKGAALNDTAAGQWFRGHPSAIPSSARHAVGSPGSGIIDQWNINWVAPNGDNLFTAITKRRLGLPIPIDRFDVGSSIPSDPDLFPSSTGLATTLDSLARMHFDSYGRPVEVLVCHFSTNMCSVGTHAETHWPYACDGCGSTQIFPGIFLWVTAGLVNQESSYDTDALSNPVYMRDGGDS